MRPGDRCVFSLVSWSSHFLGQVFTEQAGGLDGQHHDQQRKSEGIAEGGGTGTLDKTLADANEEAADDGTRDGADAAEHGGHKGFQARHGTHGGGDGGVVREVHHGADGRQEAAHRKGKGDDVIDLDAHELGGLKIAGSGTHGHADLGLLDQGNKGRHQHDDEERRDDRHPLGLAAKHRDGVTDPGQGGVLLGQAAGDVPHQVLQQVRHADGGDHNGHARCGAQGLVSHFLHRDAQQHGGRNDQRDGNGQRQGSGGVHHQKACHRKDIAVGKVDEAQDAVHHRVADGDQRILAAHRDARQQIGQKLCSHKGNPPFLTSFIRIQAKRRQEFSCLRSAVLKAYQSSTLWVLTNSKAPSAAFLM